MNLGLLSFERKSSKLPIPLTGAASLFRSANGTGIIYIFGGITTGGIISNKIISYIFSTGEINTLANLPSPAFGGSLLNDPLGNILYFGAKTMENKYDVYKFDPATKIVTIYGKYPAELELGSFTQYSSHFAYAKSQDFWGLYEVYIFEDSFRILKYAFGNMINLEKIKFQYDFNNGFLFVGRRNKKLKAIVADRSSSFDTKEINIPNKVLNNSVTIAWDGFKIYVLAGLFGKDLDEGNSTIGELVQLDPKTKTSQVYNINNYPAPVGKSFFGASAHFVQHLNTILVFGGTDGNKIMDNIWSIDLNPIP